VKTVAVVLLASLSYSCKYSEGGSVNKYLNCAELDLKFTFDELILLCVT
jgi:hypothetical protein